MRTFHQNDRENTPAETFGLTEFSVRHLNPNVRVIGAVVKTERYSSANEDEGIKRRMDDVNKGEEVEANRKKKRNSNNGFTRPVLAHRG